MHRLAWSWLPFTACAVVGQERVPLEVLQSHHARHVETTCRNGPPPLLRITGTMERDSHRARVTTWVQRDPFGFRREYEPTDPAVTRSVQITDGRYAWNESGQPLSAANSRLCLEHAFVDGLLYLDPRYIAGGPGSPEPWPLRDHANLMTGFPTGALTNMVMMRSPAGTNMHFYFDTTNQRLIETAQTDHPRYTVWTRYGAWQQFGDLSLPTRQQSGVLGEAVSTLYTIDGVETVAAAPAQLFAGCPHPKAPKLQFAGRLVVLPETVPGSASLLLSHVELNGQPVLARVDTGASRSGLTPELAAALNLPRHGAMAVETLSGGAEGAIGWLDRVHLGDRVALQVQALVVRLPSSPGLYADRQPSLLIGDDILFEDSPVFDLVGERLLCRGGPVTPLADLEPKGRVVTVPITREGDGIVSVEVTVNGVRLRTMLDTGMPYAMHLDTRALARLGLPTTREAWLRRGAHEVQLVAAGGKQDTTFVATLETLQLGAVLQQAPVVHLAGLDGGEPGAFEALLGMGALLPFARVGVDLSRMQLELELPAAAPKDGDVSVPGPGVLLGLVLYSPPAAAPDGRLWLPRVFDVAAGSPAAAAGLGLGDWLRAVDGVPCAGVAAGEINRRLWVRPGDRVAVEWIDQQGKRHDARLP